ncbi:MAG: acyl carrier protein [Bacteroidota bacterium]|nr:acyl carrier protein [Bacteroidota bacterium]
MEINSFIKQLEDTIEDLPPDYIKPETDFKKIEQWDSLAMLSLLAKLDSEYNVSLTAKDLNSCNTVTELYDLVKSRMQ